MSITFFGFIWCCFLVFFLLKNNIKKIIFMVLLSSIFQCNAVIKLSQNTGVGPMIVTSIVVIAWYLIVHCRCFKIKTDSYYRYSVALTGVILLSLCLNGEDLFGAKFLQVMPVAIYICCFLCLKNIAHKFFLHDIEQMVIKIIYTVLCVGAVQYCIALGIIPRWKIFEVLIYNESWEVTNAYYTTAKIRLFSTFKESSYCAAFLVGAFYYVLSNFRNIKTSFLLLIIILLEIILTQSTTGYVAIVICGILFILLGRKFALLLKFVPIAFVALIVAWHVGFLERVVFNKLSTGSAAERGTWNLAAFENFSLSPIYGVGYKNSRASSLLLALLAELGALGFVLHISFVVENLFILVRKSVSNTKWSASWFYIAINMCQFIACPDLDFCVQWMSMYLLALSSYGKTIK